MLDGGPLNSTPDHSDLVCELAQQRKGWFSNTSFTTGLKTLPMFRPDALVFFRAKKTREETSARFSTCCEAGIREPTLSDA